MIYLDLPTIVKPQYIRLVDVFALGPLMIWASTSKDLPPWAKCALGLSGLATITFNGLNYLRLQKMGYKLYDHD